MDHSKWFRTDLIDESVEMVNHRTASEKGSLKDQSGVEFTEKQKNRVKVTIVEVSKKGEEQIQKKEGTYITCSVPTLSIEDEDGFDQLKDSVTFYLRQLHKEFKNDDKILIIGLGNKTITPDAVGPYVVDILQKENADRIESNFYIYAPGVTAQTGYETSDFVIALAKEMKPSLIIVIDALATKSAERLCKTVQITNTGIHPGSGVGNERKEISKETIGIPVTAIGIPTVVGGPVLVSDAVDRVFKTVAKKIEEKSYPSGKLSVTTNVSIDENVDISQTKPIFGEWVSWTKEEREQLFNEILSSNIENFIVTPKEIDQWIMLYSSLVANSINEWMTN